MPLWTDDIEQARQAYSSVEARLAIAERRVAQAQATIAGLLDREPSFTTDIGRLRQRILQLEAANLQLKQQLDQLRQLQTDASLQNFIGALGMAAAIGEAAMPGRAVTSLSA